MLGGIPEATSATFIKNLFVCLRDEEIYLPFLDPSVACHLDCCSAPFTTAELKFCDSCHVQTASLSKNELASVYFICGYIALKEAVKNKSL